MAGMATRTVKDGAGAPQTILVAEDALGNGAAAKMWVDSEGNYVSADPFGIRVGNGEISGYSCIDKFGHNHAVGATPAPIAAGGIWRTPQVSGATKLRVKAGNANDTAAGSGARSIAIEGIDATGAAVTETIQTAGASAGADSVNSYIRIYRAYVLASGTYAAVGSESHAADIVIENAAGTEDWLTIEKDGIAFSQSQVALYTVPLGKKAYITSYTYGIDATKTPDLFLFQRRNILETAAPYTAQRILRTWEGVEGHSGLLLRDPLGPFPALTDLGSMAVLSSGTAKVSVTMTILLMDE